MKQVLSVLPVDDLPDFPGGHAGASLKLDLPVRAGHQVGRDFPGGHAGASLKLNGLEAQAGEAAQISPADTPGPH